jgi:VCBS repeat-containing protein
LTVGVSHTKGVTVTVAPVDTNNPPVVTDPTPPSDPDPVSGDVTGSLGVVDPDGDPLTIEFVEGGEPTYGTVTFDPVAGTYVYTPNQAGQLRAALGLGNTDSFTVRVTQGQQQAPDDVRHALRELRRHRRRGVDAG